MGESTVVGQDKLLALDIDVIDIVAVDDDASADTDEHEAFVAKLFMDDVLDLPQLESEQTSLVVNLHEVAIVAIRRDKDNFVGRDTHQIGGGGYDQILFEHDGAKIRNEW